MGQLKEKHGIVLIGKVPDGLCPECATKHEPHMPHNKQSLAYQLKFYDAHGRFPTWADAMAHCPPEIKKAWSEELKKRGVPID